MLSNALMLECLARERTESLQRESSISRLLRSAAVRAERARTELRDRPLRPTAQVRSA